MSMSMKTQMKVRYFPKRSIFNKKIIIFSNSDAFLRTAHGIVSEYISLDLSNKLSQHLNIIVPDPKQTNKRKSIVDLENNSIKKSRLSEEMRSIKEPETKETKKAKQKNEKLAKAATGSKNIMSFFGKK